MLAYFHLLFISVPISAELGVFQVNSLIEQIEPNDLIVVHDEHSQENIPDVTTFAAMMPIRVIPLSPFFNGFSTGITGSSLVFVFSNDSDKVATIVFQRKAKDFLSNVWMIVGDIDANDIVHKYQTTVTKTHQRLGISSQIFILNTKTNNRTEVYQILGQAFATPTIKKCGQTFRDCNFTVEIEKTSTRMDHGGQTIRLSYEDWYPFVKKLDNGSVTGMMIDISKSICSKLNLSIEFVQIRDPAGGKLPNGTWTGDFADIAERFVDAGIWGYIVSEERLEIADFSHSVAIYLYGFILRRPTSQDVSLDNYIKEFTWMSWQSIAYSNLFFWFVFFLILSQSPRKDNNSNIANHSATTVAIMLRTLINKGSQLKTTSFSLRCAFIWLLLMAMVLLNYYKASMNAFLNAKKLTFTINSYEDVLESDMDLLVLEGLFMESYFRYAPKGTVYHQIYIEKLLGKKRLGDYSMDNAVELVAEGKALIFEGLIPFLLRPEYPCAITTSKSLIRHSTIGIPFTKGSPFIGPVNRAIIKMEETGAMEKIVKQYSPNNRDNVECEPAKTSLGITQTFFPFVCLIVGSGLAIILSLIERLPIMARKRKNAKILEQRLLYAMWDKKKYELSDEKIFDVMKQLNKEPK